MKKILPVKEPLISTYNSYGFLFSIMPDNIMPWVYNNFIQMIYAVDWNILVFEHHIVLIEQCPAISYYVIPKRMISVDDKYNYLKNMIREAINNNEYLLIYVDKYYISFDSEFYHKEHLKHEVLVYGYEDGKLHVADYTSSLKFVFGTCDIDEFCDGYFNMDVEHFKHMEDVRILRVNKEAVLDINLNQIEYSLDALLNSKKSYYPKEYQEMVFGLDIFDKILINIENEQMDYRAFHFIYEHALLMKLRTKYLIENNNLTVDSTIDEGLEKLISDAVSLRDLSIKFIIKRDMKLIPKIIQRIEELKQEEYEVFSTLKDEIAKMNL